MIVLKSAREIALLREAGRIDAWATMLGRLTLSRRSVVELHVRTVLDSEGEPLRSAR